MINLIDDGTLDTVFACDDCGEQIRCNYANDTMEQSDSMVDGDEDAYHAWRDEQRAAIEDDHDCGRS